MMRPPAFIRGPGGPPRCPRPPCRYPGPPHRPVRPPPGFLRPPRPIDPHYASYRPYGRPGLRPRLCRPPLRPRPPPLGRRAEHPQADVGDHGYGQHGDDHFYDWEDEHFHNKPGCRPFGEHPRYDGPDLHDAPYVPRGIGPRRRLRPRFDDSDYHGAAYDERKMGLDRLNPGFNRPFRQSRPSLLPTPPPRIPLLPDPLAPGNLGPMHISIPRPGLDDTRASKGVPICTESALALLERGSDLSNALERKLPEKERDSIIMKKPWCNDELRILLWKKQQSRQKSVLNDDKEAFEVFKDLRTQANELIRKLRRTYQEAEQARKAGKVKKKARSEQAVANRRVKATEKMRDEIYLHKPWCTDELRRAIARKRELSLKSTETGDPALFEAYKQQRSIVNELRKHLYVIHTTTNGQMARNLQLTSGSTAGGNKCNTVPTTNPTFPRTPVGGESSMTAAGCTPSSIAAIGNTPSTTAMGNTHYMTAMGTTPSINSMGHTPSLGTMGHTPVNTMDHQPFMNAMGNTPSTTAMGHTPMAARGHTNINSMGHTSMNTMGHTPSINTMGHTPAMNAMGNTPSTTAMGHKNMNAMGHTNMNAMGHTHMNVMHHTPSMNTMGHTPSMNTMGHTPSMHIMGHTPSMDTMGHTPSMNTMGHTPMNTMGHTPSMDTMGHTPSMDTMGHTPSMNTMGHTPMNTMGHTPSMDTMGHTPMNTLGHPPSMTSMAHTSMTAMSHAPSMTPMESGMTTTGYMTSDYSNCGASNFQSMSAGNVGYSGLYAGSISAVNVGAITSILSAPPPPPPPPPC